MGDRELKRVHVFVRPALRSFYGEFTVFVVTFAFARFLFSYFESIENTTGLPLHAHGTKWLLVLIPLLVATDIARRYLNNLYVLGRRNMVQLKGRLSFRLRKNMVRYADIRKIDIKQSVLGRLLNYGTVRLYTAATTHAEVRMCGVSDPQSLMIRVDKLREKCLLEKEKARNKDKAKAIR